MHAWLLARVASRGRHSRQELNPRGIGTDSQRRVRRRLTSRLVASASISSRKITVAPISAHASNTDASRCSASPYLHTAAGRWRGEPLWHVHSAHARRQGGTLVAAVVSLQMRKS